MNITFYGHSCFSVDVAGKTLLFDPFITPNPAAENIDLAAIKADYILLTHGHEDHIADAESLLKSTGAVLMSNFEIVCWYQEKGFENCVAFNIGGKVTIGALTFKYVTAEHSSSLPDGSYGGNPGGFVIESPAGSFYVSGDTGLTYDMKMLSEFHHLDWAALCIGDNFTMGYEDAAICAEWAGVDKILGLHYDTFPQISINHSAAQQHFLSKSQQLYLPEIGESISI